jgi:glycosyltransferase involved in cell wall biosynthesis
LIPSIIDPVRDRGGAGAITRAFVKLLQRAPLNAQTRQVPPMTPLANFHRARQLAAITRSVISSWPSKAAFTYSRRSRSIIRRLSHDESYDLVLLNGSDLLWMLPDLPPQLPTLLLAHNIEHRLFLSQINSISVTSPLLRRAMLRDWRRLERYEITGLKRIKNVIFLSAEDAEFASAHCPGLNVLLVPPLFDYPPTPRIPPKAQALYTEIGFLGNFGWWPNRHGLHWFLNEVFPYAGEKLRLHLFGEGSQRSEWRRERVIPHGYIADLQQVWSSCDFMVCPIFSGGGAKIKLAEALYNGIPVLASSFAARGLPLNSQPGVVLLDHAKEWIEFLRSSDLRSFTVQRVAEVADAFSVDAHTGRVHRYIQELTAQTIARKNSREGYADTTEVDQANVIGKLNEPAR